MEGMVFWIVAILTLIIVAALMLQGLWRGKDGVSASMSDVSVYRDQLDEVDRDRARGVLSDAEAETVRLEISRRLLDADKRAERGTSDRQGGRNLASVAIPVVLLLGAFGLYATLGAPGARDLPIATRLAEIDEAVANRPNQIEAETAAADLLPEPTEPDEGFMNLMEELRTVLADRPDDIPGLMLLARNEARIGNFVAARKAQEHLVAVKGAEATTNDLAATVETMTFAAGGYISPEAETYLRRLLELDPQNGFGRYFLGLFHVQSGRPDRTFPIWQRLLADSQPNAPWVEIIRSEMPQIAASAGLVYQPPQELRGPDSTAIAGAEDMSEEDRQAMIRGMVEGLSSRLADEGGSPEEWMQLVRALTVLGEEDRARIIYNEAKQVYGESEDAMRFIFRAGIDAGLE